MSVMVGCHLMQALLYSGKEGAMVNQFSPLNIFVKSMAANNVLEDTYPGILFRGRLWLLGSKQAGKLRW